MWQTEQDLACPGCHHPRDEVWLTDDEDRSVKEAKVHARMRECVICSARGWANDRFRESTQGHPAHGIFPVATMRRDAGD